MGVSALRAVAAVAQSAGADAGVWVALAIAVLTGGGGLIAGVSAFASNRRQARADAATGVREDTELVLQAYRDGMAELRTNAAAGEKERTELRAALVDKDQEIVRLREELEQCQRTSRKSRSR